MKSIKLYYTDNYDGKSSHELLLRAAALYSGEDANSFAPVFSRGKKPYFSFRPDIHFSISHSGSIWLCAFSEIEVGADVQIIAGERPWEKLAARFFHPSESDAVKRSSAPCDTFTDIWSRKEAVVKLLGIGIDGKFTTFDSKKDTVWLMNTNIYVKSIQLDLPTRHSAAIACLDDLDVRLYLMK